VSKIKRPGQAYLQFRSNNPPNKIITNRPGKII
jgi:hypothetical protein